MIASLRIRPSLKKFAGEGYYVEVELPVDNIFTWYGANPSLSADPRFALWQEQEFISNQRDSEGSSFIKLFRADGSAASLEEVSTFLRNNPHLTFAKT